MNAKTCKLLVKISSSRQEYRGLKRQWRRLSQADRARDRKAYQEALIAA